VEEEESITIEPQQLVIARGPYCFFSIKGDKLHSLSQAAAVNSRPICRNVYKFH